MCVHGKPDIDNNILSDWKHDWLCSMREGNITLIYLLSYSRRPRVVSKSEVNYEGVCNNNVA